MRPVSAAPAGTYFDHIVIIAMENTAYKSVFGSGTVSSCPTSSAPFLCSMLPLGSTIPSMDNYGATAADANDFNGCSAACYVGLLAGYTYGISDGYGGLTATNLVADRMAPAGLTWQAYCESGCPRGNDHFPFTSFTDTRGSSNIFAGSSVSTSTFTAAANSATPPNFLWYTPSDSHNMHDVSVSTGDSYLRSFLVGSGSITSPASGSLLASNVFTNSGFRTLLYLWWDECGGSNGSCDSNNDAPNLLYGTPVKKGYVSPDTTGIDEYASLRTIENNWGFLPLAQGDTAASNAGYMFNDVFGSAAPLPLSASFTFLPNNPAIGTTVAFTATAVGGTLPYSYSWSFGDGSNGSGAIATHSYTSAGQYNVSTTVTDMTGKTATSSKTVTVTQPIPLNASFSHVPSRPVSGQSVTFTASANGGTSPYNYAWNLAGTNKTGNPVSQSFSNGTYTISLTVTDNTGKTATSSQSLLILPASTNSSSAPMLTGWGGIRMDESAAGSGGTSSAVFPGEYASNMELLLMELKAMGYNTVRVDFDPYCSDTVDFNSMSVYSQTNAQRAVQIAEHYGFWIIIDYHGYSDIFRNTSCWLSYWKPIVQNIGPLYSQIIWEPENEPEYSNCNNSPSSCPSFSGCTTDSNCVAYLASAYEQWVNQTRSLGDIHWIVAQNLCSYACGFSDMSLGYPTVTDPLGTLSQGGRIFISLHSYMNYGQYSGSWTNATAESVAQQYYQAVLTGESNTGWPALNTEGGTDPLCSSCTPDTILSGSAGYTAVTFHFIQTLVNLYDSNSPQRINWVWWPAGSWTNTPGAGTFGAMQCNSNPIGWGCLLQLAGRVQSGSDFTITAASPSGVYTTKSATATISVVGVNGFNGTVALADQIPSGLNCGALTTSSITGTGSATVSCNSPSAGNYPLTITGTSGFLTRSATAVFRFKDFVLIASSPPSTQVNSLANSTITVTGLNGFSGTVSLTDTVPSGLTCASITPNNVTGNGNETLSCDSMTQNVYNVSIAATSGSLTHSTVVSFAFGNPPDFTISSSQPVPLQVGSNTTSTITVTLIHGFNGPVVLTDKVPSDLNCTSISPTTITANSTATMSCRPAAASTYTLTITGTSGSLIHTSTVILTAVDFTLSASPASVAVNVDQAGMSTITVTSVNGFGGVVSLTTTVSPTTGMTCNVTPTSITGSGSATLSCIATTSGSFTVTVTDTSGTQSHSAEVTYSVAVPDFTVTPSSVGVTMTAGTSGTTMITVTSINAFTGKVSLTTTVSPSTGLTCILTPTSVTLGTSDTSTLSCSGSAGRYTVTVKGTSGARSLSQTVTYAVQDFTVSASPSSLSLNIGTPGASTITVAALNGFAGNVTVTTSSPTSLSTTLSTPSIKASGTLTLTVNSGTVGAYSVVITGTSGSLTRTANVTVNVGIYLRPVLSVPTAETVTQLATLSFTVNASDHSVPVPTLTLSAAHLPYGASFGTVQGPFPIFSIFSWTPSIAISPGTYTVTFTVTDGVSSIDSSVDITVIATNLLPVIIAPGLLNTTVGASLRFTISASDPTGSGGNVILSAAGLISDMAFDPATGAFSFTPSQNQAGQTFIVNFTATDSNNPSWTSTQTVPIHVKNASNAPSPQPSPVVSGSDCLTCSLESGILSVAWLLLICVMIAAVSSVALLTIKRGGRFPSTLMRLRSLLQMKARAHAENPAQSPIKKKKSTRQRPKRNHKHG